MRKTAVIALAGSGLGAAAWCRRAVARCCAERSPADGWLGYDAGTRLTSEAQEAAEELDLPEGMMYCDETGCWIGEPPPITLPDGRKMEICNDVGVELGGVVTPARRPAQAGIFAPVVGGAKAVMGEKELNKLRGEVIAAHSKVISAFVDTSESPFGQIVLKQMFEAADKDGNGTLDREEIRDALHALGFKFIGDKQLDTIFERADDNGDLVIDFEEFVKETPKRSARRSSRWPRSTATTWASSREAAVQPRRCGRIAMSVASAGLRARASLASDDTGDASSYFVLADLLHPPHPPSEVDPLPSWAGVA